MNVGTKALVIGLVVAVVAAIAVYFGGDTTTGRPAKPTSDTLAENELLIRLESGNTYTAPYVRDRGIVWAAADLPWWKEIRGGGDGVTVVIGGDTVYGRARAIENDDALQTKMFALFQPPPPGGSVLIEIKLAPWALQKGQGRS